MNFPPNIALLWQDSFLDNVLFWAVNLNHVGKSIYSKFILWWTKCQLYATNSFAIDLPQSFCFALIQFDAINFVTQLVNLMLVGDGGCISPFTFTNSNVNSLHSLFLLFKPRRNNYRSSIGRKNFRTQTLQQALAWSLFFNSGLKVS